MGWSTRQLAELTGTTLRAVRHYHEVGLLEEPERRANGYKQYGVAHLVRVLRIKRLTDLGFSLAQIQEMGDADDHPEQALRTLDAELAETIERLQRARVELGLILNQAVPTDLPPELAAAAKNVKLSDADRSFSVVMSRVLGSQGLEAYAELLQDSPQDPSFQEFDDLPVDADEAARQDLAERMAGPTRAVRVAHPVPDIATDGPLGRKRAGETIGTAMRELYSRAQIDVLVRLEAEIKKLEAAESGSGQV
ncbi:DNA-binding transcriptional MerR regulator [Actinomycetospora succinea]|uniref:DNA-binding transcriptional MerR regulator n=1 Tax=Actinomycetospora succinea TaxID=663603 RepID=A0A4R6V6B1_9PSEU|nr:MerR family transcriptional regulator [Actinomycetospora succinea]TDQ55813.1 DNA-binding transcriptional MerR regulator [Actinomycetospora succinea]